MAAWRGPRRGENPSLNSPRLLQTLPKPGPRSLMPSSPAEPARTRALRCSCAYNSEGSQPWILSAAFEHCIINTHSASHYASFVSISNPRFNVLYILLPLPPSATAFSSHLDVHCSTTEETSTHNFEIYSKPFHAEARHSPISTHLHS